MKRLKFYWMRLFAGIGVLVIDAPAQMGLN